MFQSFRYWKSCEDCSGDVIKQRVGSKVDNLHSLLLYVNATHMFAKITELGNEFHVFDVDISLKL